MSDHRSATAAAALVQEPLYTATPATLAELTTMVAAPGEETLVPVAGGTQTGLGNPPSGPWASVRLSQALSGPLHHAAEDMTIDVPAGASLAAVNEMLRSRGQYLPIDPPLAESATIGGTLAVGIGGPLRTGYGLPRELILGMTALRPDGELVRAGGNVVKNVTGYDLMRLWCGSLGTLGIITRASLRVFPLPSTTDLSQRADTYDEAARLADAILLAGTRPLIADAISGPGGWLLVVRVEHGAVPAAIGVLGRGAKPAEPALVAAARDTGFRPTEQTTIRISTVPSALARATETLAAAGQARMVARPLAGFLRATWAAGEAPVPEAFRSLVGQIRALVASGAGSVVVEQSQYGPEAGIDAWGDPGPSLALMRRAKEAWDPRGRLNRGRFIGGI